MDRAAVEAWLESIRLRLKSAPVPIIEWAQPVMLGALQGIYGRAALRRFQTSLCIGLFFTATIFGIEYWRYRHIPIVVREAKAQLERDIDPILYSYATDPRLRPVYERSQKSTWFVTNSGVIKIYGYTGGIYDELRNRVEKFRLQLVAKLFDNPDQVNLTILFLLEGTYLDRGFSWRASVFLFAFNVLLDFASVTIIIACLQRLGRDMSSFLKALVEFGYALVTTLTCASASFLSYRLFFQGDIEFFEQLLVILPMILWFGILGFSARQK